MTGKRTLAVAASASLVLLLAPAAATADDQEGSAAAEATEQAGAQVTAEAEAEAGAGPEAEAEAGAGPEAEADAGAEAKRPPTGRFEIGAGFDADELFIAQAKVVNTDLFRTGIGLSLTARLSARSQLFLIRATDYRLFDTNLSLTADLYNHSQKWTGFTRRAAGTALTLTTPLGANTRGFIGYRLEDVELDLDAEAFPQYIGDVGLRDGIVSAVRVGVSHDTRDRAVFPTRGTHAGAYLELAHDVFGSELQFAKAGGWLARHGRIAGPLSLHTRVALDGVWTEGIVPLTERVRLRGHRDVRGYGIGSVDPLGGNVRLTTQTELELSLSDKYGLSAVAFFDAGGVWDLDGQGCQVALLTSSPVDPCAGRSLVNGLRESVGFGLVWDSPVGPMRFDWAFPLDKQRGQGAVEFLFSIGGVF